MDDLIVDYCGAKVPIDWLIKYHRLQADLPVAVKAGSVELSEDEAYTLYINNLYVMSYSQVHKICRRKNGRLYARLVYRYKIPRGGVGLTRKGKWVDGDGDYINRVVGEKVI